MPIELLVAGISIGAVYGIVALGLVVIHSATNIVNFAQGSIAAIAAYVYIGSHRPETPLALLILAAIVTGAVVSALVQVTIVTWAERIGEMNAVMATVALLLVTDGVIREIWGPTTLQFPRFLPEGIIPVGSVQVSRVYLSVFGVVVLAALLFWLLMRFTEIGLVIRGAADNPEASRLMGIEPRRVAATVWAVGGILAAIAGLMIGHLVAPRPEMALGILVKAFAGAVVGGFASPIGALIGAILLGVAEVASGYYIGSLFQDAIPLVLLVLFLVVRPSGLAGTPIQRAV